MRTVPFKRVFDKAIRWKGLNPYKDVPPYEREAMVDRINDRVRQVLKGWVWPEWTLTEQRAFRQIWNDAHRYLRVSTGGKPDEVFYIETLSYYQVRSDPDDDPPVGTLPTDTDWWLEMDSADVGTYIAYDQGCRRSIGTINGVFQSNPSGCRNCDQAGRLKYHPSQNGLEICQTSGPTVFIDYQMPVPSYTMVPYAEGRVYQRANVIFDPASGECFQALVATTNPPTTTDWGRVPFLEKWENFVVFGAYADALSESDNENNVDVQQRQLLAMKAEAKADDAFQAETDELRYQGQVLEWSPCKKNGYWCETIAWSGADVVELDEECQDALGWIFPAPPAQDPIPGGGDFHCPTVGECPGLAYISEPNVFENVNTLPGLRVESKEVNSDYTLTPMDFNVLVDATDGIINIFLPLALGSGQLFHITKSDESDNPVIVTPQGGDLIDGETSSVLGSQYADVAIIDGALAYWDKLGLGFGDVPTELSDFARKSAANTFADLNTFTGVQFATKIITADDSPYPFDLLDFTLLADASDGPVTILLPPAIGSGQLYHVKKIDGTDGVVTIQRHGTDTIDGSVSVNFVEQWGSALLQDAAGGYWDNIGSEILLSGAGGGGGTIELPLLLDNLRILADGTLQIFNATQGKFHTISINGTAGAEYITIGAGVP